MRWRPPRSCSAGVLAGAPLLAPHGELSCELPPPQWPQQPLAFRVAGHEQIRPGLPASLPSARKRAMRSKLLPVPICPGSSWLSKKPVKSDEQGPLHLGTPASARPCFPPPLRCVRHCRIRMALLPAVYTTRDAIAWQDWPPRWTVGPTHTVGRSNALCGSGSARRCMPRGAAPCRPCGHSASTAIVPELRNSNAVAPCRLLMCETPLRSLNTWQCLAVGVCLKH